MTSNTNRNTNCLFIEQREVDIRFACKTIFFLILRHFFFSELRRYEDILNESKIWELDEYKRVQFVYVLQSKYFSKASSEFKNVSRAYLKVQVCECSLIGEGGLRSLSICQNWLAGPLPDQAVSK